MDKISIRKALVEARLNMPDRLRRADLLQRVMRIWLVGRPDEVIGAYWPIKGEFDPLPALYRWQEDAILSQAFESTTGSPLPGEAQLASDSMASRSPRKIGLPVVNKLHKTLTFHAWYPGCPMEEDAYWPIKGEFDPLPALYRWQEDAILSQTFESTTGSPLLEEAQLASDSMASRSPRKIGLPVVNKLHKTLTFHAWYPGCPMEEDAYGIPKPKGTEVVVPTLLFVPCVGYGPGGFRLGYGGGFYDRTLATLQPKPLTVGLGYTHGWLPDMDPEPHDVPLDAVLNDNGVVWPV